MESTTRERFDSIDAIRKAHDSTGGFWFSPDTMRFFGTRIHDAVYGGRVFVTSEQPPHGPRNYSVRMITDDYRIETLGEFGGYETRDAAHRAAQRLAETML